MPPLSLPTVRVHGLDYLDAAPSFLMHLLEERLSAPEQTTIFTPNAKIAGDACRDAALQALLQKADLLLPDGAGILLASRRASRRPLTHRLPGIEAGEMTLALAARHGHPIYFLGSRPDVARLAAAAWQKRLPSLIVAGTHHGYFDRDGRENEEVLTDIQRSGARVLLVCLGFPAQERWIVQSQEALPDVRMFLGLGGSLDVWAGKVRRAPALFRTLHSEWLWRMLAEPRRFAQFPSLVRYVFGR